MESGTLIHYIEGVEVERPKGELDFTEELTRNFDRRIIGPQYPITVTFKGGGYERLRTLFLEDFCTSVTYTVDFDCGETYRVVRGIISVADVVWNLNKCEAEVKVRDDGHGARIVNNAKLKVSPTGILTKNGLTLAPIAHKDIELFSSANVSQGTSRGYDWLECMSHLVSFITDNEVTVVSDWYDALPDSERYAIFYGREVRVGDGSSLAPSYSFEELWPELWKKYNLWAYVSRSTTGDPVLKIEQEPATYTSTTAKSYPDQDDLEQSVDTDRLFVNVEIGSETYIKNEDAVFPLPFLTTFGFTKESWGLSGTCNSDNSFNLVSEFIIDTNVIDDCRVGNNDEYDENIFLIQYTDATDVATMGQYLDPGSDPWLYNEQLLNVNVIARFPLPANIIFPFVSADISFLAELFQLGTPFNLYTVNPVVSGAVNTSSFVQTKYNNDYTAPNHDASNSWGNGTVQGTQVTQVNSRYTAQAQGVFVFHVHDIWSVQRQVGFSQPFIMNDIYTIRMRIRRFNAANTLLQTIDEVNVHTQTFNYPGGGSNSISPTFTYEEDEDYTLYMGIGDYVIASTQYEIVSTISVGGVIGTNSADAFFSAAGSTIETTFSPIGGGDIIVNPDEYRATRYHFDRSCPASDWVSLRDNPIDMVRVATDQLSFRNAHVKKATRFIATGETEWELIANRAQQFK